MFLTEHSMRFLTKSLLNSVGAWVAWVAWVRGFVGGVDGLGPWNFGVGGVGRDFGMVGVGP